MAVPFAADNVKWKPTNTMYCFATDSFVVKVIVVRIRFDSIEFFVFFCCCYFSIRMRRTWALSKCNSYVWSDFDAILGVFFSKYILISVWIAYYFLSSRLQVARMWIRTYWFNSFSYTLNRFTRSESYDIVRNQLALKIKIDSVYCISCSSINSNISIWSSSKCNFIFSTSRIDALWRSRYWSKM